MRYFGIILTLFCFEYVSYVVFCITILLLAIEMQTYVDRFPRMRKRYVSGLRGNLEFMFGRVSSSTWDRLRYLIASLPVPFV